MATTTSRPAVARSRSSRSTPSTWTKPKWAVLVPAAGDAGLLRFDVDETHGPQIACDLVGRNLTRVEWSRYVGGTYHAACAQFPPGK
jgi:hypothetical protein